MADYTIVNDNVVRDPTAGQVRNVIIKEAVDAGEVIIQDPADGLWKLAINTEPFTSQDTNRVAFALSNGVAGQTISAQFGIGAIDVGFDASVAGLIAILSENAGKLQPPEDLIADSYLVIIGSFDNTGRLVLNVQSTDHIRLAQPVNDEPPTISGTPEVGSELTCTPGTWSTPGASYAYQWYAADDDQGTGLAEIAGATALTYTLTGAEDGKYILCRETATNANGSTSADTAYSGPVSTPP